MAECGGWGHTRLPLTTSSKTVPHSTDADCVFYAALLRFVARKTERSDPRIAAMMDALTDAACEIEAAGHFCVAADRLELTARAFAGVAAFLQKQILPEAVSEGNTTGEQQIRWAVDTAMAAVNDLLTNAARQDGRDVEVQVGFQPPSL